MIAIALGLSLGAGVILVASPWMWPGSAEPPRVRRDPLRGLRTLLVQAGLSQLAPSGVIAVCLIGGLAAGVLMFALVPVLVMDVAAGLAAAALPFVAISARARSRRRALQRVWPDAIDHLVAGLRSGSSLAEALGELGHSGPAPLRPAFAEFAADVDATARIGVALDELKHRLADPVADRVIETIRVAREVGGGQLPAVLRACAAQLRADAVVRSEVEARQSWLVGAARLGVAAPWAVLLLLAARPEAVQAYNSPAGAAVLLVGAAVTGIAYRVMIALGRLPSERRWFA